MGDISKAQEKYREGKREEKNKEIEHATNWRAQSYTL